MHEKLRTMNGKPLIEMNPEYVKAVRDEISRRGIPMRHVSYKLFADKNVLYGLFCNAERNGRKHAYKERIDAIYSFTGIHPAMF